MLDTLLSPVTSTLPATCAGKPAAPCQVLEALQQRLRDTQRALEESLDREQKALHLASHDALTGLPNRRAVGVHSDRTLDLHAASASTFCLMYIDLDGFKAVNDRMGHAAGDALLRIVGERLAHGMRRDDFVGRMGGDEFVCILPRLRHGLRALRLAHKLIETIAEPAQVGACTVHVRASIGLAMFPRDGDNVASLLACADGAMRQAKAGAGSQARMAAATR